MPNARPLSLLPGGREAFDRALLACERLHTLSGMLVWDLVLRRSYGDA